MNEIEAESPRRESCAKHNRNQAEPDILFFTWKKAENSASHDLSSAFNAALNTAITETKSTSSTEQDAIIFSLDSLSPDTKAQIGNTSPINNGLTKFHSVPKNAHFSTVILVINIKDIQQLNIRQSADYSAIFYQGLQCANSNFIIVADPDSCDYFENLIRFVKKVKPVCISH